MGKSRKATAVWAVFLRGTLLALGVYLAGQLLLALLQVRGVLPEQGGYPATAVVCGLSSLLGGLVCVRRSPWGTLPGGLLTAALFALLLIAGGLLFWHGITWTGRGGVLLLCALGGGVLSGLLGGRRGRRGKRKRRIAVL